jgi:hypothetical protein
MLNQIIIYSSCVLGIFLFFRYVVRIRFVTNQGINKDESQNHETDAEKLSHFLAGENKEIEAEISRKRYAICSEFSDSISALFGKYFDLKKITADMESIRERVLLAKEPLLFHHEAWEMFKMMEIVTKLQALIEEALQTRSKKKKSELVNVFYTLKESLKEYKLPYAYGQLGEYEAFLATCNVDEPETQQEEADEQECGKDTASTTDSTEIDPTGQIAGQIEHMFAETPPNNNSTMYSA